MSAGTLVMEKLRVIDNETVAAVLSEAVAGKPEGYAFGVERVCRYTDPDGSPACIVGHVLDMLGIERPLFEGPGNAAPFLSNRIARLLASQGVDFSDAALDALDYAQTLQDGGATWEDAAVAAIERLDRASRN